MFGWLRKSECDCPRIGSETQLESLFGKEILIVFKHSPTCMISWAAHAHVEKFRKTHPHIPLYLVSVREDRDLSRHIAERTNIRHASPQIIVLCRGQVTSVASHDEITESELAAMALFP